MKIDIVYKVELTESDAAALQIILGKRSPTLNAADGLTVEQGAAMSELFNALWLDDEE